MRRVRRSRSCTRSSALLDTVISAKYFAIALTEVKPSYHHGQLDSGKIDEKTTFYLAVATDMPGLELVDIVPLRFKIGAPDDVDKFVLSAMPGVRLQHAPQVPAAVPVRPNTYYFHAREQGPDAATTHVLPRSTQITGRTARSILLLRQIKFVNFHISYVRRYGIGLKTEHMSKRTWARRMLR